MGTLIVTLFILFFTIIWRMMKSATRKAVFTAQYTAFTVKDNVLKHVYMYQEKGKAPSK